MIVHPPIDEGSVMMHSNWFNSLAKRTAQWSGHPATFGLALLTVVAWAVTGPLFGYGETWQLSINTFTTIVTFLMVFLVQNTQNRDSTAIQLKLDELIRVTQGAHNVLLDLEELDQAHLEDIRASYEELARKARTDIEKGEADTGSPEPSQKQ